MHLDRIEFIHFDPLEQGFRSVSLYPSELDAFNDSRLSSPYHHDVAESTSAKDRADAEHDYEVNLKAELEIMALHEKMDSLREKQWEQLLALQQDQIGMLKKIVENVQEKSR